MKLVWTPRFTRAVRRLATRQPSVLDDADKPRQTGGEAAGTQTIPQEWLADFEAAARRPLETRFRYAFIHTYKPVLDDAQFRAFDTMEDYRRWCEANLPDWLGYGRV